MINENGTTQSGRRKIIDMKQKLLLNYSRDVGYLFRTQHSTMKISMLLVRSRKDE